MSAVKIGRPVRAHGLLNKITAIAAVTVGLTIALPATPAAAVSFVNCGSPVIQEYARVETDYLPGPSCFANAGAMNLHLFLSTKFHSGNNKVTFFYTVQENNYQTSLTLEKWQDRTLTFGFHATVTSVVIW
ncbi:beta/gamma crystallin domain-containing protein [Streptomyces sp. NPDC005791]|uniref:beta/gamma crystallin domain-containing protein n=1 Tax=Streptomyces sp. NPDC005791 TaxID=3364732 RepID=UPI00368B6260